MLRKKDKLPADVHSVDFELEYGKATIEVHKDSINENDSILIIDDLIAFLKVFRNLISAKIKFFYYLFTLNTFKRKIYQMRLLGLISSMIGKNSYYRPNF